MTQTRTTVSPQDVLRALAKRRVLTKRQLVDTLRADHGLSRRQAAAALAQAEILGVIAIDEGGLVLLPEVRR